ncbi:IS607 family transposase [Anabaenopsis sp. FSS-46]|nr:IS607 family transposase [Anabaenopsis sp. FSS-46]MDH6100685.1 IS607 family transposase [Anabaenopsis sp. FSS-46]
MKLSDYAKKVGISYRTAWRWYKSGVITGYQQPTGTIIINLPETNQNPNKVVAIYCRVSDNGSKDNLERQAERLTQYATARGYTIYKVVKEIGSGLNDNRKQLSKLLKDDKYNILLAEHPDRVASFGLNYLKILLNKLCKELEIVNQATEGRDELMQDLVSIIYSFSARMYGLRRAKTKTERITQELQNESD